MKYLLFSTLTFSVLYFIWFFLYRNQNQNKGTIEVGDLENFRYDENGDIYEMKNGEWSLII